MSTQCCSWNPVKFYFRRAYRPLILSKRHFFGFHFSLCPPATKKGLICFCQCLPISARGGYRFSLGSWERGASTPASCYKVWRTAPCGKPHTSVGEHSSSKHGGSIQSRVATEGKKNSLQNQKSTQQWFWRYRPSARGRLLGRGKFNRILRFFSTWSFSSFTRSLLFLCWGWFGNGGSLMLENRCQVRTYFFYSFDYLVNFKLLENHPNHINPHSFPLKCFFFCYFQSLLRDAFSLLNLICNSFCRCLRIVPLCPVPRSTRDEGLPLQWKLHLVHHQK